MMVSLQCCLHPSPSVSTNSCLIQVLFELVILVYITFQGFGDYLHSEDHEGTLLNQNKEGVYSLFGYWCLHILGACIGKILRSTANFCLRKMESVNANSITPFSARFWLFIWYFLVLGITLSLFASTQASNDKIDGVSRRSCNLTYVLWISAYSMTQCLCKITIQVSPNIPSLYFINSLGIEFGR